MAQKSKEYKQECQTFQFRMWFILKLVIWCYWFIIIGEFQNWPRNCLDSNYLCEVLCCLRCAHPASTVSIPKTSFWCGPHYFLKQSVVFAVNWPLGRISVAPGHTCGGLSWLCYLNWEAPPSFGTSMPWDPVLNKYRKGSWAACIHGSLFLIEDVTLTAASSPCLLDFLLMINCTLKLWARRNPFLLQIAFVQVFYHRNKNAMKTQSFHLIVGVFKFCPAEG